MHDFIKKHPFFSYALGIPAVTLVLSSLIMSGDTGHGSGDILFIFLVVPAVLSAFVIAAIGLVKMFFSASKSDTQSVSALTTGDRRVPRGTILRKRVGVVFFLFALLILFGLLLGAGENTEGFYDIPEIILIGAAIYRWEFLRSHRWAMLSCVFLFLILFFLPVLLGG